MYLAQQAYRTLDSEAGGISICRKCARDAGRSQATVNMRRLQFALFAVLIAVGAAPLCGAAPGSVSGSVRDSSGVPQIGAEVQLLHPDLTPISSVYTDSSGHFVIPSVLPGRYAVKAMGAWFLPSLREDVRVRANTVVNLTLNTLYEAMQWLPAEPRAGNAQQDDWAWTLRTAANRPLLRWLEDGPLVVVTDGSGSNRRLKARLVATGREGVFGESGERISAAIEETPADSRELLAQVEFEPDTDAGMESMLGFRQDLGFAGSVQSVAAVAAHPEISAGGAKGLEEAVVRTWETIHLGDEFDAEVGSNEVLARLSSPSSETLAAMLPFVSVGWLDGNSAIRYRMTTMLSGAQNSEGVEETQAQSWLPTLAARKGRLAIQKGRHQELGWERRTDRSGVSVMVYGDEIESPVIEAAGHFAAGDPEAATVLLDPMSGLFHAAGPDFFTAGVTASFEHRLPGGNHLKLGLADGDALMLAGMTDPSKSSPSPATLAQIFAGARPRRAQAFMLSLSGTLEGTGTRWRASYRWQPEDTVTLVAPFAQNAAEPYLNLHLRQPIRLRSDGTTSFDAVLDMNNLLAQGYRPYVLSDGSLLIFAQNQRSIRAGLAFNF